MEGSTEGSMEAEPVLALPSLLDDLAPGQLSPGWRTASTVGWLGVVIGLFAVHDTADFIGKPTWWQLHGLGLVPFIIPLIAGGAAYVNWRWTVWVSFIGALSIGVSALVSRTVAPGAALVEAAIALAVVLLTIACLSGRVRRRVTSATGAPAA